MGMIRWATSPWGQSVPTHAAWELIWVAVIVVVLIAIAGAIFLTTTTHHPKPVTAKADISCLLDRDGDCPAGEPDNDGNP